MAEPASGSVFTLLLVGLLILLLVPTAIVLIVRFFRSRREGKVKIRNNSKRKQSRVKLKS